MPMETDDRYRKKYLDLVDEIDAKEKQWAEIDRRVRRILTHLLIVAEGPTSTDLAAELNDIRQHIKEGLELEALERMLEELRDRILRETRWAEVQASFPPLHQILIHLVERLPLPAEMSETTLQIVHGLEAGIAPDGLPEAIDSVAGLVWEGRARVQEEKHELETLLEEITGRLQDLGRGIGAARKEADAGFASSRSLDKAVRAEMQGLERSALESTGVEGLRAAVSKTLDAIGSHLASKEQEDRALQEAYRREVERLRDDIARLEHEVEEHREKARQARESSLRDPITNCPNRLAYRERAIFEEARWQRYRSALSVIVADVDKFKAINDTFGHKAGDQALRAIAQLAASQLRQTDFFGRYGGEEFVILLPETGLEAALTAAEKVRRSVEAFRFHARGKRVVVTLSCGVAQLREGDTVESAFERADQALYAAKNAGRNRSVTERETGGE